MILYADFHIHSRFSMATSKLLTLENIDFWARIKGLNIVGTGDFTHPGWSRELKTKLEPAEPGLFKLKSEYIYRPEQQFSSIREQKIRFMLTAEISTIYKKNGKIRKVHNIIFSPDFRTVEKIQKKLQGIGGNITANGRPILGLDSRDLLELSLDCSEEVFFLPAHIWTPWFSVLGSKSGFDSIEDCYQDLTHHIYALETGLSSDPAMNWFCSNLDNYTLISNSDAHSPEKLGRNANIFDVDLSYYAIINAIKSGNPSQFLGTVDLFPQEGKYHFDGHRKCNVSWSPAQTSGHKGICPVCGHHVTVGVMNRINDLTDRKDPSLRPKRLPYFSIITLKDLLSEISGIGPNSKKINNLYINTINNCGSELSILLDLSPVKIAEMGSNSLANAIIRMRNRDVHITEGYDGQYGRIRVLNDNR